MTKTKTETTLKLKVGDKAIVRKRLKGHMFNLGTKIIIRALCRERVNPHYYATEFGNRKNAWWVNDKEITRAT